MELISFKHPVMSFLLNDPPYLQLTHDYIIDNFIKIKSEIENSYAFKRSLNFPIKCEIKEDATFVKCKDVKIPETLKEKMKAYDDGLIIVPAFNTYIHHMGLNSAGHLHLNRVRAIISDLSERLLELKDAMEQSGWSFLRCEEIRIIMYILQGKPVQRTKSGGTRSDRKRSLFKKNPKIVWEVASD